MAVPQAMPNSGRQEREAHGEERAEGDEQDDGGGEHAERLAAELLLRQHVGGAADLEARAVDVEAGGGILDRVTGGSELVVAPVGEVDVGVGDPPALGDLALAAGCVGADDLDAVDLALDLGEHAFERSADGGIVDAALGLDDELDGGAGAVAEAALLQEVEGVL